MNNKQVVHNLRYLLWHRGVEQQAWRDTLAQWAGCSLQRAETLLNHGGITIEEAEGIAEATSFALEELLHSDLVEGLDIQYLNLKHLLTSLERGGQQRLANAIGVDPTTVSRWRAGKLAPSAKHLAAIADFFALRSARQLSEEPLFLERGPVGAYARRAWLRDAVQELRDEEVDELFPALRRLFSYRDN